MYKCVYDVQMNENDVQMRALRKNASMTYKHECHFMLQRGHYLSIYLMSYVSTIQLSLIELTNVHKYESTPDNNI